MEPDCCVADNVVPSKYPDTWRSESDAPVATCTIAPLSSWRKSAIAARAWDGVLIERVVARTARAKGFQNRDISRLRSSMDPSPVRTTVQISRLVRVAEGPEERYSVTSHVRFSRAG